jgi:hypothetical protein
MRSHSFSGLDGRWEYTRNHQGENLPEESGPWHTYKIFKLKAGPDDLAVRIVGEKGYHLSEKRYA